MSSVNNVSIGQIIKASRKRNGLTQKALAEHLSCSLAHIGRIEIGIAQPSVQLLQKLQDKLPTIIFDLFPFFNHANKQALFSHLLHNLHYLSSDKLKTLCDLSDIMRQEEVKNTDTNQVSP